MKLIPVDLRPPPALKRTKRKTNFGVYLFKSANRNQLTTCLQNRVTSSGATFGGGGGHHTAGEVEQQSEAYCDICQVSQPVIILGLAPLQ